MRLACPIEISAWFVIARAINNWKRKMMEPREVSARSLSSGSWLNSEDSAEEGELYDNGGLLYVSCQSNLWRWWRIEWRQRNGDSQSGKAYHLSQTGCNS